MSGVQTWRYFIELIPAARPEVVIESGQPAILHGSDFAPVTDSRPAAEGEVLVIKATGLGPVRPVVEPGQAFPADQLAVVNSTVEVTVDGRAAEVINAVGWPGTADEYRLDVRIPTGISSGRVALRLTCAWIPGPDVRITIRK
jgi:uncharacterized protein (TIGR03437 family)